MADQSVRLGTGIIEALGATYEPGYERIKATCADYFASFSGSWFDRLARHDEPNRITADDLVAVSMLSTPIDPHAGAWMLGDGAEEVGQLLAQIPPDTRLWEVDEDVLEDDAPLSQLWHLLQEGCWPAKKPSNGVGAVTAGKLLAAKRPLLVPIYDDFIETRLQPPRGQFWKAMRNQLLASEDRLLIAIAVGSVHDDGPDHPELSLLRRIDIAVWKTEWDARHRQT